MARGRQSISERPLTQGQLLVAEFIGSTLLVYVLVSSALLANGVLQTPLGVSILFVGIATVGWLFIAVEMFGPISGAHVNPTEIIALLITGDVDRPTATRYILTQFAGGLAGVVLANRSSVSTIGWSTFAVSTVVGPPSTWLAGFLGSWLLASVVTACIRRDAALLSLAVGCTVGMGSGVVDDVRDSAGVARPYVHLGITGVRPFDGVAFIITSTLGGIATGYTWRYLWPRGT